MAASRAASICVICRSTGSSPGPIEAYRRPGALSTTDSRADGRAAKLPEKVGPPQYATPGNDLARIFHEESTAAFRFVL